MLSAAERLVRVQQIRAFEAHLGAIASAVSTPCLRWAAATVAVPGDPARTPPTVVVLVGLGRWALCALGVLHLVARHRVARALRAAAGGYRVRVWVRATP